MNDSPIDTAAALKHFKSADPVMYQLLTQALAGDAPITIPELKQPSEYFARIVNSIVGQQISVKAAAAVRGRVEMRVGEVTPDNVLAVPEDELKACGLSGQKTKYIRHNAEYWHEIPYGDFVHMSDEEVIHELTKLYGIGRWTAEMFLMFSLARPDVFSYGDLGLMQGLYEAYNYKPHYVRKIANTVDSWSPHRTLASLSLWRVKDGEPVIL